MDIIEGNLVHAETIAQRVVNDVQWHMHCGSCGTVHTIPLALLTSPVHCDRCGAIAVLPSHVRAVLPALRDAAVRGEALAFMVAQGWMRRPPAQLGEGMNGEMQ